MASTSGRNRPGIGELANDIILFLVTFRRAAGRVQLNPAMVRQTLLGLFARFEAQAKEDPRTFEVFDKARYLIAVTCDDLALGLDWEGAEDWQMLEEEFYRTRIGGTRFYECLDDPSWRSAELNEVFFMCLVVGFKGKYMIRGQAELDAKREELFLALRDVPKSASRFTPEAYDETITRSLVKLPAVRMARVAIVLISILLVVSIGSKIFYSVEIGSLNDKARGLAKVFEERK